MKKSIAFRAFLAVILMVGFYLLGLVIAGILLYIPYAEWNYAGRLHIKLAFFCVVGAGTILISLIPRRNKFIQPGPLLNESEHPLLFKELKKVAELTNQEMPKEVYLITEVNAWVSQYGGFWGLGSKRIMGIGLALLQTLDISEFRAVLVHEFGHYHGGDTKLAPWVYKTRGTIERTLQGLGNQSSILQKPFLLYGKLFLKVTHSVSRAQELTADKLAARVAGSDNFISGLTKIHASSLAFDSYWREELAPVLGSGFLPPVADGFNRFIKSHNVARALTETIQKQMESAKSDPYDTHPPLKERIDAVKNIVGNEFESTNHSQAISLVEHIQELEKQLLTFIVDKKRVDNLKPIDWEDTAVQIYIPFWESVIQGQTIGLKDITPVDIPKIANNVTSFTERLKVNKDENIPHEALANKVIGSALAYILYKKGWNVNALPGEPVVLRNGDTTIKPFEVLSEFASGKLQEEEWIELCRNAGINAINIGRVAVGGLQRDEQLESII